MAKNRPGLDCAAPADQEDTSYPHSGTPLSERCSSTTRTGPVIPVISTYSGSGNHGPLLFFPNKGGRRISLSACGYVPFFRSGALTRRLFYFFFFSKLYVNEFFIKIFGDLPHRIHNFRNSALTTPTSESTFYFYK